MEKKPASAVTFSRPQARKARRDPAWARSIATDAFVWVAGDDERLGRFLDLTGLAPGDLRAAAAEPGFFASVMDFVAAYEPDAAAFAQSRGLSPEDFQAACALLGGAGRGE